jgi:hypothetical protein
MTKLVRRFVENRSRPLTPILVTWARATHVSAAEALSKRMLAWMDRRRGTTHPET